LGVELSDLPSFSPDLLSVDVEAAASDFESFDELAGLAALLEDLESVT
jgi:hypothetical protein